MKKRPNIKHMLSSMINKLWGKLIAFIAITCILFALVVPLSHRLIAKNGAVDLAEELVEKVTDVFGSSAEAPSITSSAPAFEKELTLPRLESAPVPAQSPDLVDAEGLQSKGILAQEQSATVADNSQAIENAVETRTVTLQLITQDGRYPVSDFPVYLYGFTETDDYVEFKEFTNQDGRIVFDNVPLGSKYHVFGSSPETGYQTMAALDVKVPSSSQQPKELFFSYSVSLQPFELVINNVDEKGQPLGGSSFSLLKGQQAVSTGESIPGSGIATLSNIPTAGVYRLKQHHAPIGYQTLASEIELSVCQSENGMPVQAFVNNVPYTEGLQWNLVNGRYQLTITVRNVPKDTIRPQNASLRIRKVLAAGGQELTNTGELMEAFEEQTGLDDVWFAVISLWDKALSDRKYTALEDYQAAYQFYLENLDSAQVVKTTTINGIKGLIELEDLPTNIEDYGDSRYLILELNDQEHPLPAELLSPSKPLIVNLPTLSEDRKSYNFDVKLYPKNEKVSADVEIFKSNDQNQGLAGAEFQLYKQSGDEFILVGDEPYRSNAEGKIFINELGAGTYYLQEITPPPGYQLDSTKHEFEITRAYHNQTIPIQIVNNLAIVPPVKTVEKSSYDFGEAITWTLTQELPRNLAEITKFEIYDKLDSRLSYIPGSIEVVGLSEEEGDYEIAISLSQKITTVSVKLKASGLTKLAGQATLTVRLQTTLNTTDPDLIENTVQVITNISDKTSAPAQVNTGSKPFRKINETGQSLTGAEFVVRKKVNEQLLYMKRTLAGTEWLPAIDQATRLTSTADGSFAVSGLAHGTYELIETKAPTTAEGQYGLKSEPVSFLIDDASHLTTLEIRNYLVPSLPITGGIGITALLLAGLGMMGTALWYYQKLAHRS